MPRSLTLAVFTWALLGPESARAADLLPLDQVRPGMTGVGRTVFEGTRIDEFQVRVLGVLENAIGPKQSVILARLDGGPLDKTGMIAGMSGSPVFIDGKLVGAVAYAFPFGKEPIAGITPIGDMIEATRVETPRAASARFTPSRGPGLALPLAFSGFEASTFEWARGVFAGLGFAPVLGASASARGIDAPIPALAAGSAIGGSLIEGDLDLSVSGTVTLVENDRVYAFGHPFYNLGPTQFPMKKAYVYSVFPSLQQSWKIATALDAVGTVDQDRTTAIAGRIGQTPHMIPVEVKLNTSRGTERRFSFRLVEDELFSPLLTYVSLLSVLQGNERAFGTSTIRLDGRVALSGGREIRVQDLFTVGQPSAQAAALVAAPLAFVMTNEFQKVTVERLDLNVTSYETTQSASVQRAWVERAGPVRAGSTVSVKVALRTFRGDTVTEVIPLTIPTGAPAGNYSLLVADAGALTALEQREMRQPFIPKDLDQLIRAINGLRKSNHLYARLFRPVEGAIVSGEYLPSLPASVLAVLGAAEQGTSVVPLRTAAVWDFELPTDYAVSGSRLIQVAIER